MNQKKNPRGRPKKTSKQLSSETILECARQLLKREGKIPSIRKLAKELEIDPMAIYHYYTNKAALLETITVSLISEIYTPIENAPWKIELIKLCRSYIQLLTEHPGLLETLLSMQTQGPALVFTQRFSQTVSPLQLSQTNEKNALNLLTDYLHGFAFAVNCNTSKSKPDIASIEAPLELYFQAIIAK